MSKALDARNRLGGLVRLNPDDTAKIAAARRDLAAAKLADYIERVVSEAPDLSTEQREKLAQLLRGGVAA